MTSFLLALAFLGVVYAAMQIGEWTMRFPRNDYLRPRRKRKRRRL